MLKKSALSNLFQHRKLILSDFKILNKNLFILHINMKLKNSMFPYYTKKKHVYNLWK